MAVTPKRLVPGSALTNALATYYTVPASTTVIAKELVLCNTDVVTHTVDLHIVPNGGTAVAANQILQNIALTNGETKIYSLSSVMEIGATIQASADAGAVVSIAVSGVEIT